MSASYVAVPAIVRFEPVEVAVGHCALTMDARALTQEEVIFQVPTMLPPHAAALPHVTTGAAAAGEEHQRQPTGQRNRGDGFHQHSIVRGQHGRNPLFTTMGSASCADRVAWLPRRHGVFAIVLNPPNSQVFVSIAFCTEVDVHT